ncbi:MAG: hypothetical protein U0599_29560 [Vicinamibacteria bacterium]
MDAARVGGPARRLTGWKAIAGHLGKGVRTTQRWEKLYGLPVRREAGPAGEVVTADADELDRWSREASLSRSSRGSGEARSAAAPRRDARRASAIAAAVAVVALAGVAARALLPTDGPRGAPASWLVVDRMLSVFDANGRRLFSADLGYRAGGTFRPGAPPYDASIVAFADLDGDGSIETLTAVAPGNVLDSRLQCFDAKGRRRFVDRPVDVARFGGGEYAGPWVPNVIAPVRWPDGGRSLFVGFTHRTFFPAVVQELSPRGEPLAAYWSSGHVRVVAGARFAGRDVVLVGGVDNQRQAGLLALFDRGRFGGKTPTDPGEHRCDSCPDGPGPREVLLFPRSCLWRRRDAAPTVLRARVDAADRLLVEVSGDDHPVPPGAEPVLIEYGMAADLRLGSLRPSTAFLALHREMERRGELDHAFSESEAAALRAVRRFDGRGFVPVPGAPGRM